MSRAYSPKKVAELEADVVFVDKETGFLKVHNNSVEPVVGEKIYYLDINSGKKSEIFDFAGDFYGGLAFVGLRKKGFGYINTDFEFVIEPVYDEVSLFENGIAKVYRDGKERFIDRSGELLFDPQLLTERKYSEIGCFADGLCMVSAMPSLERDFVSKQYCSDNPGIWGFINTKGEEVIKPQYIFAQSFQQGTAIAAKGEWVFDPEDFIYTPNDVRWGVIDKNGNEIVPFEYSQIRRVSLDGRYFAVCRTLSDKDEWGIADCDGNLLLEPKFKKIREVHDGLAVFFDTAYVCEGRECALGGVYDIAEKKVIIEPKYSTISFAGNGYFKVCTTKKGRSVETFIDRNGNEVFDSQFNKISTECYPYLAIIGDARPMRYGLIDRNGTVLFVSPEGIQVYELNYEKRRAVYTDRKDLRKYLCDMDGNELTEHIYSTITDLENPLFTVYMWSKSGRITGLIDADGNTVVDPMYDSIEWLADKSGYIASTGRKREIFKL